VDFEDWLRAQLSEAGAGPELPPGRAGWRPELSRPIWNALQLAGVAVAAAAVVFGATFQLSLADVHLSALSPAPALPANTWAGSPPPPPPDSKQAADDRASAAPVAPAPETPSRQATSGSGAPQVQPRPPDGQGPPGPAATTAPAPATGVTSRTFTMVGGSATVSCGSGTASLVSATPNPGFEMESGLSSGGTGLEVRFRSDTHESRLEASCSGLAVQGQVEEEAR